MLQHLAIKNVVLIDSLAVEFGAGLNVLTGETGAGKSILLDSLSLALGGRSEAGLVRAGEDQASVTATFSLPLPSETEALLKEQDLEVGDALLLRRVLGQDGKSRAFVNDQPIGIGLLKQIGETLLEIHGQFDTHGLLNAANHRLFLDSFGKLGGLAVETADAFKQWKEATTRLAEAEAARRNADDETAFLRGAVDELDALAPQIGEADQLASERKTLQQAGKIGEALQTALTATGGERGAAASLAQAGKAIARLTDPDAQLKELLASIDRLAEESSEIAGRIENRMEALNAAPTRLSQIEERLFDLRAAARKHQVQPDELPALRDRLAARLELLEDGGDLLAKLSRQAGEAKKTYQEKATALSVKRKTSADSLVLKIAKELPPLKLEKARFAVEIAERPETEWNADGKDRLAFVAAANPGSPLGPLQKVASGGELSRFMLAIKLVLNAKDSLPTLVFDEVDAGIGGAVASAVGERLARLADKTQILVVTHSPQVAARGAHHWRIEKKSAGKTTRTSAIALDRDARREEIARMLSGATVTDAARKAAESLIKDAKT